MEKVKKIKTWIACMARANLNKSEKFLKNDTVASKHIPKQPRIN